GPGPEALIEHHHGVEGAAERADPEDEGPAELRVLQRVHTHPDRSLRRPRGQRFREAAPPGYPPVLDRGEDRNSRLCPAPSAGPSDRLLPRARSQAVGDGPRYGTGRRQGGDRGIDNGVAQVGVNLESLRHYGAWSLRQFYLLVFWPSRFEREIE